MANLVKRKHAMGSKEEQARELVQQRTKDAAARNSGHMRLLRKFWRYYLTSVESRGWWRRENDRDPGSGAEWRANLFVPASFSMVETAVPRIVFALFGARPYVKVIGRERSDVPHEEAVTAMLEYDFQQSKIILEAVDFFKSLYVFGTAVGRVDYYRDFYELKHPSKYEIEMDVDDEGEITDAREVEVPQTERVMRYDGPRFKWVPLDNFFPDPQFWKLRDMRFATEREESTVTKLKEEDKRFFKITGKHLYRGLDKVKPYKDGMMGDLGTEEDIRQDTAEVMRFNYGGFGSGKAPREEHDEDTVVLYHYWEPDRYIVMANGHDLIREGLNPYQDKRIPFVSAQCFPTLKEFYGQGLIAPIQFLQEELNTVRNIALDQGKMNLMGIWAVDEGITISDADFAQYPGKTIQTEFQGGKPLIANVFDGTLPSDFERLEDRCQRDIQSALAINDYMVGAGGGSAGTASEAAMLNASAANRFRLQALLSQESFVTEVAEMFLSRRQQFLNKSQTFRVLGEEGYWYPEIGPEEIWGQYDFEPQGSQSQPNKEVLRQQMIQLMSTAAANPALMTMTNWAAVYKELWGMFDIRFPERFILAPPHRLLSQQQENYILLQGEKVAVEPNDPHEEHAQQLLEAMAEMGEQPEERVREAVQDHMDQHQKFMQGGAGTPAAQTPGNVSGAPGNAPGTGNQQVPTLNQMQAQVQGGPGGPVT